MTKSAKVAPGPAPTRSARTKRQEQAVRRRQQQNLLVWGGAAFFVLLIGLVVYLNVRSARPVAGEEILTSQGNYHIEQSSPSPIEYNSIPPTSGPHYGNLVAWNIYSEPQRYEQLVHNLEDGGIIVYYQCPEGCLEIVEQLRQMVEPYITAGKHMVMVPNDPTWIIGNSPPLHQDMGAKIAVTAWTRILKMDEVDEQRIRAFIDKYIGIDHHVAGVG
jgi:hypothetical protein